MTDHETRTRAWHADLAAIVAELDRALIQAPKPAPRRRRRLLRPLWEE